MNARHHRRIEVIDVWRKRPVYRARIVRADTAAVVIKSTGDLKVGKRISFVRLSDVKGAALPDWRSAVIWRIEAGCLHLTRT